MDFRVKKIIAANLVSNWSLKEMLEDIERISILTIPVEVSEYLLNKQWAKALAFFSSIMENDAYDDDKRLIALWLTERLKTKIRNEEEEKIQEILDKKEKEENEQWQKEIDARNAANESAMEIRRNTHAQWTNSTQDECNQLLLNYVLEKFPLLNKGYDRSIFSTALYSYRIDSNMDYYRLTTAARMKYDQAVAFVASETRRLFDDFQKNNIGQWVEEFKKWIKEHGLKKYTKESIKLFFKEKQLKVSVLTIDTIYVQLNE